MECYTFSPICTSIQLWQSRLYLFPVVTKRCCCCCCCCCLVRWKLVSTSVFLFWCNISNFIEGSYLGGWQFPAYFVKETLFGWSEKGLEVLETLLFSQDFSLASLRRREILINLFIQDFIFYCWALRGHAAAAVARKSIVCLEEMVMFCLHSNYVGNTNLLSSLNQQAALTIQNIAEKNLPSMVFFWMPPF